MTQAFVTLHNSTNLINFLALFSNYSRNATSFYPQNSLIVLNAPNCCSDSGEYNTALINGVFPQL